MINRRVHIAILDDGVNVNNSNIYLYKNLDILDDLTVSSSPSSGLGHSLKSFLIIQKNLDDKCYISSIKILGKKNITSIDKLCKGLEICKKMKVDIINLSLGSIMFYDRDVILKIVNELYSQGVIIVAATSNEPKLTYPASFSNVICTKANGLLKKNDIKKASNNFLGVDFELFTNYRMKSRYIGEFCVGNHNSYSAPIITALVANIYREIDGIRGDKIEIIKKKIYDKIKTKKINIYYDLDWLVDACLIIVKNQYLYNELLEVNKFSAYNRIAKIVYVDSIEELKEVSLKKCKKYKTIVISEIESCFKEILKQDINSYYSFQYVFLGKDIDLNYNNIYHNNKIFGYYDILIKNPAGEVITFKEKPPIVFVSKISRLFFLKLLYKFQDEGFNSLVISDDPYMIIFLSNCIYVNNVVDERIIINNARVEEIISNRNIDIIYFFSEENMEENRLQFVDLFIESRFNDIFLKNKLNEKKIGIKYEIEVETIYDEILNHFK